MTEKSSVSFVGWRLCRVIYSLRAVALAYFCGGTAKASRQRTPVYRPKGSEGQLGER